MDWDQIERKWAAMTRRVRADWPIDRLDKTSSITPRLNKTGVDLKSVQDAPFPSRKDTLNAFTAE